MTATSAASTTGAPATASRPPRKPKSPAAPSLSLRDCVTDVGKLYGTYNRGNFSKAELATILRIASDSGPTNQKLYTYREFGLLAMDGDKFKITEDFIRLKNATSGTPKFKRIAYRAVVRSALFKELLESFHSKLPARSAVAMRLEQEKNFNEDRANSVSGVLEDSLKYASVLDGNGNIVVPREDQSTPGSDEEQLPDAPPSGTGEGATGSNQIGGAGAQQGALKIEIALKEGRKAVVFYPPDMAVDEAAKVGNVLKAVVG
jgi:hypothetical protein